MNPEKKPHILFPSVLGQLLSLLHGNVNSSKVIITEFQGFCRQQSSSSSSSSSPELSSPQISGENIPTRWTFLKNKTVKWFKVKSYDPHICGLIQYFNQATLHPTLNYIFFFIRGQINSFFFVFTSEYRWSASLRTMLCMRSAPPTDAAAGMCTRRFCPVLARRLFLCPASGPTSPLELGKSPGKNPRQPRALRETPPPHLRPPPPPPHPPTKGKVQAACQSPSSWRDALTLRR